MSLLRFERVCKRFPDGSRNVVILDDASFAVERGEVVGLHGPRRSGKSTLLRIAAGIELPDSGRVLLDDRDLTRMSEGERARLRRLNGTALVYGDWRAVGSQPVVEHVAFGLLSDGLSPGEARVRARAALERVGAHARADTTTDRLSIGERIRVELARALVREPRLLLIDEPAVLSSPSECRDLYALLRSLGEGPDLTLLIASEDVAALRSASMIMAIDNGRLRTPGLQEKVIQFPSVS